MKRILSFVLALVLVLTLLPTLPLRAEATTGGKLVALTFDDGPSSVYTPQLLDGLKERGVPVTFFFLGERADDYPSIVRRAYEEGHEIACHTWDHPNLTECSESKIKKQISDTFEVLDLACGDGAEYLVRPPYGSTNQKVRDAIDAPLIYWSVDSEDWSLKNVTKVRQKIVADTYDGAIILCHDIHKTTIPAALGAIDDLKAKGYEFVTVSELFRRRGRELQDHKLHYNSNKNGIDYGPIPAPKITFSGDPKGVNTVTLSCADTKAPLYYTLDGSYPNQEAKRYTGPFTVPYGTTVTAVAAYKLNGSRSQLTVKTADQVRVVAPTITLDEGGNVVMTTPTVNSKIFFTVDNTKPSSGSLLYTGPEAIVGGCFLRAVTVHAKGTSAEAKAYLSEYGDLYYDMYEGQWFYEAMDWAYRSGIVSGTDPYTMEPGGIVTRGMMVTLLYRFSGDKLEDNWEQTSAFQDVSREQYYAKAVEWAYRNKIVSGYSAEEFGPNGVVTRQEMCRIIAGFLSWKDMPLRPGESCEGQFGDYDQVAPWALDSVEAMVAAGLLYGSEGDIKPNSGSERCQVCVVLRRLSSYMANYVPEEPEPSEPEHTHEWKLNNAQNGSTNWGSVTIDEGEFFELSIECEGCGEIAPVEWTADPDGVVLVDENVITGILGGYSTLVQTVWEEVEYECLVYVRAAEEDTEPTDPTEPEPSEPTEPEPSNPTEPTEPDPSNPTDPTEPEPSDPTEPEHVHSWKLNKQRGEDPAWGEVSIDVGEKFTLKIICTDADCKEVPTVEWVADPDGVVLVEGNTITGLQAGKNTRVRAQWEDVIYECLIHVRKDAAPTEPTEPDPSEPDHAHIWKLNKSYADSLTKGDVSIKVGETFSLHILCRQSGCDELAPITWTPSVEGVVSIDGMRITGVKAGTNTTLSAEWEGQTYSCIVRVRKQTTNSMEPVLRD